MPVYIDDMNAEKDGMIFCHMLADTHEELMQMAALIGLKPAWLQHEGTHKEHFDITIGKKRLALARGAQAITYKDAGAFVKRKREALQRVLAGAVVAPAVAVLTQPTGVFVCTRRGGGARKCTSCQAFRHDVVLCDYPLHGSRLGETCARVVCQRCAVHVGDKDYCPPHDRLRTAGTKEG